MCSMQELNIILSRISQAYKDAYGNDLIKIMLYGSYARGNFDVYSDIDIVAIAKGNRADLQRKLNEIWDISAEMELEFGTIISPTVIPYDEYEKYREDIPYYRNIEQEGVAIVA